MPHSFPTRRASDLTRAARSDAGTDRLYTLFATPRRSRARASHAGVDMSVAALRIALVGNPNCGKTALFNQLTGSRQKVANYAGVTVERKEGRVLAPSGRVLQLLDLPGAYSFEIGRAHV